jgi:Flp pilus assembly pilin Flp
MIFLIAPITFALIVTLTILVTTIQDIFTKN